MSKLLRTENISKYFGGVKALVDVNMEIRSDEILGIIGPNGAGKTTLFNVLTGFDKPNKGRVFCYDKDVTGKPVHEMCKLGMGRTFQNIRLFGQMKVIDNLVVGMHTKLFVSLVEVVLNSKSGQLKEISAYKKAHEILKYLKIDDVAFELASNLPYGKQRKVEIARALASQPKLLLLDEPSAGMNPKETEELIELIEGIKDNFGPIIIIIEHNMQLIMGISDRIIVLNFGEKIAEGTPKEIQNNKLVIEAYLGQEEEKLKNAFRD
jgi:branched-chain amino acid transport system ATP-binding protein